MTRLVSKSLYALAHDFLSYGKGVAADWIVITYRSGEAPLLFQNLRIGDFVRFELEKDSDGEMPLYRLRDAWARTQWDDELKANLDVQSLRFYREDVRLNE